jgi:hypothetical protein
MALTHWKKLTNPDYLGAYSIEDGQDLVLTISKVQVETVVGSDGKKEECMVCYFHDSPKPMILNSTNAKQITKLLGTPYIEHWAGHKIQIGIEKVKAFGDLVEALRVRKFLPKVVKLVCEKCGGNITAASGMNPEQLAAYTQKKYGAKLCAKCATALAQKAEEEDAETAEDNEG